INRFIPKKTRSLFMRFVNTFYRDFPSFKYIILPFLVGFIPWILIFTHIYILGLSLGINIPYFTFIMIYPIANAVAFIPISAGGLGTREATLIFLFSFYGVGAAEVVVLSLAGHILTDMLPGFVGFILSVIEARNHKMSYSEAKRFAKEQTIQKIAGL
ncbi:MAG: flippase-like domain-containing protein, partial [Thermoplasmatales archaeon]